jgi:TDG/mug DNA glycosylase family protein
MKTLPDYLRTNLDIVLIGLNPSPISVRAGYYYANPRNRFWAALNGSRLLTSPVLPGEPAIRKLFDLFNIGFTDIVKRPTPMGNELRAADFRKGAIDLQHKLLSYQPRIAWFNGITTYSNYLKYTGQDSNASRCGAQPERLEITRFFVTPNPSPANASYSLDDLITHYNALAKYRDKLLSRGGSDPD